MSLARFLDKAALAAAQALRDFDRAGFERTLLNSPIRLLFGEGAAGSVEGQTCLDLAVRLLARLYPVVLVEGGDAKMVADLEQTARAIHPGIILDYDGPVAVTFAVGSVEATVDGHVVYVGSEGWTASISSSSPCRLGTTSNPFGAGAAACFGAAAVFKTVFADWLPEPPSFADRTVSVLRPWADDPELDQVDLPAVDVGETHLVGLGAIGNAVVWALARTEGLAGQLHLIDGEHVELSNLQRYVLTVDADAKDETPKASLAERELSATKLYVLPHEAHWDEYLAGREDWGLPRVAIGVDSPEDRIAVQASLPRVVLNAWTQSGDLGVSRHSNFLTDPCLACLYVPDGKRPSRSERVAAEIGLHDEEPLVRNYLQRRLPVDRPLLAKVAAAVGVDLEKLTCFEGYPLDAFYAEFVCGGQRLRMVGEAPSRGVDAPLAFQSTLAGILLAAEIIADAGGLRSSPPPTLTRTDIVGSTGVFESENEPKGLGGRCLCQDGDFRQQYEHKYVS